MRLVLLPGLHGTEDLFGPLLEALPREFETSVVSYPTDRVLGYEELQPLVDAAAPRRAAYVLLGESFSGPLAIRHAAAAPKNLRGLVLCATFAKNPLPRSLRWLRALARRPLIGIRPPRTVLSTFLAERGCDPELLDEMTDLARRVDAAVLARRIREIFDVDATASLPAVEVPVLYLAGSRDRLVGRRGLTRIAAYASDVKRVVLDAPHLVLQTRPAESAREIARFVESLSRRAS